MRISPTSPTGINLVESSSDTTSISIPGSISPIEPGLSGPSLGCAVPGEQVSVMPQPLFSFMPTLLLEDPCDLDRQRRAARADADQRGQVALVEIGQ